MHAEKRTNILFLSLLLLMIASVLLTFYRTMVVKDYVVTASATTTAP